MKERRLFDERAQMQQSPPPMRTLRYILAGLCAAAVAASAQTNNSTTNSLTLEDCIQTALQHNFDVQITRYNPRIARYNLNSSYGGYDPTFSFSGAHDFSKDPAGFDPQIGIFTGTISESDSFSSSFQGLLPLGLSYTLSGNISDRTTDRAGVLDE